MGLEQSQSRERGEGKVPEVKDPVGKLRTVTFTLRKARSCWRVFSREGYNLTSLEGIIMTDPPPTSGGETMVGSSWVEVASVGFTEGLHEGHKRR